MQIIKKSSNGIQSIPLESALLAQRKIFLTGAITTESANTVIQQLLYLESEADREPIKLIINSPGGEVGAGLMLYDQIKGMEVPIELYCVELAASIAAVILAGGKRGNRFILRHSKVKLQEPSVIASVGCVIGNALSVQKTAESIMETKNALIELLSKDTGHSREQISRDFSIERLFNGEEAVKYGICDSLINRV